MTSDAPYFRLSGFYFWYFAFVGAYGPFFALYLQDRGFDPVDIAMLMAVGPVARIFVPNVWGWLADRYRGRDLIQRALAFVTPFIAAGLLLHPGFAGLLTLLILWSVFWSGLLPLVEAGTMTVLRAHIGAYGRVRLWGSIGFIVVVVGGGYWFDAVGVGALEWIIPALLVCTALTVFMLPRDRSERNESKGTASLRAVFAQPGVAGLIAGFFLMQFAHGPYNTFYSIYLVEGGYTKTAIGWLWALGVVAEIILFMWLPQLMRRWRLQQVLIACFAFAVLRFLLIAWGLRSLPIMMFAQLLHAMTFGAFHAAGVAATHQVFGDRLRSRGQALYSSLGYGAGGACGTLAAGYAWAQFGGAMTFSFAAAAALLALVLVRRSLPAFH